MHRILIIHPEGNVNNNPNLNGIVEILCENGYEIHIYSPRFGHIDQYAPCAGSKLILNDATKFLNCVTAVLPKEELQTPTSISNYINSKIPCCDLVIGIDRGIIEASIIAKHYGVPYGMISYEILFADETGNEYLKADIMASQGISFAVCQDRLRSFHLSNEYKIPLNKIMDIPVAGRSVRRGARTFDIHEKLGLSDRTKIALYIGSVMYPWAGIYELIDGSDLWPDNWALVLHERYSRYNQEIVNKIASKEKRNVFLSSFKALPFNQIHKLMHSADIGLSLYLPQFQSNDISARKNLEYLGMSSGKTTTYLQYGLPILINEVGIISEHTRRNNLGRVVKEISDIRSVLLSLTSRELSQCRENSFTFFEGVLDLNLNIKPLLSKIHSLVTEKKSKELSQFENKIKEMNYTRSESINDRSDDLEDRKVWVEPTKPSPEKLCLMVKKFLDEGKKMEAIGAFEAFLALYPNYAQAHNDLGLLYCQNGAKDKALTHYDKAVKLAPDNYTFQKNLADFYYVILEQIESSLVHYAKALSYNPADIHTLLMLGHISVSKKKFDEAIGFYNQVLKIEPWNKDAREKLDKLHDIKRIKVHRMTAEDSMAKSVTVDTRRIEDRVKEWGKDVAE